MQAPHLAASLLLGLFACKGPAVQDSPQESSPPVDDSAQDSQPIEHFSDVQWTLSEQIAAVGIVTFNTELEASWVRFGRDGDEQGYQATAQLQEDGSWRAVLLGVPADTDAWFEVGAADATAEREAWRTGEAPEWATFTREGETQTPGFLALARAGGNPAAIIVTTAGEPVWWWERVRGIGPAISRVQLSPDRQRVVFNPFSLLSAQDNNDTGALVSVSVDGSDEIIEVMPTAHHDFLIRDDDTWVYNRFDDREVDGVIVRGDELIERTPDGTERLVWSAWDSLTYQGRHGPPGGWWTNLNHIAYVPEDNDYLLSLKNVRTVMRIDGATGALEWQIGGDDATLTTDTLFNGQHGLLQLEDDLWVFDNRGGPSARVTRYRLDLEAGTATVVWTHELGMECGVMGDMHRTETGGLIISWSQQGLVDELNVAGERVQRLDMYRDGSRPTNVGYVSWYESLVR